MDGHKSDTGEMFGFCEEISFPRIHNRSALGPQPPQGYDAVIGEPGGDLNYDECVGTCRKKTGIICLRALIAADYSIQRERISTCPLIRLAH